MGIGVGGIHHRSTHPNRSLMSPITHLARLHRSTQVIIIVFALATTGFFGAGVYAVSNSREKRIDICGEVKELRDDVVRALDILTEKSQAPDVQKARKTIGTPTCDQ